MNAVKELLDNFWIIRSTNKDKYFRARNDMEKILKFSGEFAGWQVISNEKLIKLEKIPVHAKPYMGITEFKEKEDYYFLCALLIFLEDLEDNDAFLLSEMIEQIEIILGEELKPDWTLYNTRKSLVRMMQYANEMELIIPHEGDIEKVSSDIKQEVLYENTGYSRYFVNIFQSDVFDCQNVHDFERPRAEGVNLDRGHFRINRVYRNLLLEPVAYYNEIGEDSDYIRAQRHTISKYIEEYLGTRLDVHKECAFLLFEQEDPFGEKFPSGTGQTLNDIILFMCGKCRDYVEEKELKEDLVSGGYRIPKDEFILCVKEVALKYGGAWSKEYREKSLEKLTEEIIDFMRGWRFLDTVPYSNEIELKSAVFKFRAHYPKDFDPDDIDGWNAKNTQEAVKKSTEARKKPDKAKQDNEKKAKKSQKKTDINDGQMSLFDM